VYKEELAADKTLFEDKKDTRVTIAFDIPCKDNCVNDMGADFNTSSSENQSERGSTSTTIRIG
jgi:hypothetical protein